MSGSVEDSKFQGTESKSPTTVQSSSLIRDHSRNQVGSIFQLMGSNIFLNQEVSISVDRWTNPARIYSQQSSENNVDLPFRTKFHIQDTTYNSFLAARISSQAIISNIKLGESPISFPIQETWLQDKNEEKQTAWKSYIML